MLSCGVFFSYKCRNRLYKMYVYMFHRVILYADNFFDVFTNDIVSLTTLGISYYRMSLSWRRLVDGAVDGQFNDEALMFYGRIFDILERYQIVPLVTLFHGIH